MSRQVGLMTGGSVGQAFLAHYATHLPFGPLLFVINPPFHAQAWRRLGKRFTLKTLVTVPQLALLSALKPQRLALPVLAAGAMNAALAVNHQAGRYMPC